MKTIKSIDFGDLTANASGTEFQQSTVITLSDGSTITRISSAAPGLVDAKGLTEVHLLSVERALRYVLDTTIPEQTEENSKDA